MGALADFLFPPKCAGCDRPGTLLCAACESAIVRIDPGRACPRCGAPSAGERCPECGGREFAFASARCAALLEPPVSRAIVVLKDDAKGVGAAELINFCSERLASYKVPSYIEFRDMLPKSKVGKLLRREIRDEERRKMEKDKAPGA